MTKADRTVADTMISCQTLVSFHSRLIRTIAPDTTPVSYPNRNPPMADRAVRR